MGEEKYIYKIESETKRWEKKEKKKGIFAQEITQGEATRFGVSFYKVFVKHKLRRICEAWINVVK